MIVVSPLRFLYWDLASARDFAVGPGTRKGCHYISVSKIYLD